MTRDQTSMEHISARHFPTCSWWPTGTSSPRSRPRVTCPGCSASSSTSPDDHSNSSDPSDPESSPPPPSSFSRLMGKQGDPNQKKKKRKKRFPVSDISPRICPFLVYLPQENLLPEVLLCNLLGVFGQELLDWWDAQMAAVVVCFPSVFLLLLVVRCSFRFKKEIWRWMVIFFFLEAVFWLINRR